MFACVGGAAAQGFEGCEEGAAGAGRGGRRGCGLDEGGALSWGGGDCWLWLWGVGWDGGGGWVARGGIVGEGEAPVVETLGQEDDVCDGVVDC